MKRIFLPFFLVGLYLLAPMSSLVAQQKYKRKQLNYNKLKYDNEKACPSGSAEFEKEIFDICERNQSATALEEIRHYRDKNGHCERTEYLYVWALWQNGQVIESQAANDSALIELGPHPRLIQIRGFLSLKAAENGVSTGIIDNQYQKLPESQCLPFDPKKYRETNEKNALRDFEYLKKNTPANPEVLLTLAKTYDQVGKHRKSTTGYEGLLNYPEYEAEARIGIMRNAVLSKKYHKAEEFLLDFLAEDPYSARYLEAIAYVYSKKIGQKKKAASYKNRGEFYKWTGENPAMPFSDLAFTRLSYLTEIRSDEERKAFLNEIDVLPAAESTAYLIAILNMRLYLHKGPEVEIEVVKMLGNKGPTAVQPLLDYLENTVSTSSICKAASALATLKDERAWDRIVELLADVERMKPSAATPSIPASLIAFDKARALPALLPWIKQQLESKSTNPEQVSEAKSEKAIFMNAVMFEPLTVYSHEELYSAAMQADFTEIQREKLVENVAKFRANREE